MIYLHKTATGTAEKSAYSTDQKRYTGVICRSYIYAKNTVKECKICVYKLFDTVLLHRNIFAVYKNLNMLCNFNMHNIHIHMLLF